MIDKKTLREQAENYLACFSADCQVREHCLRWQVGQEVTGDALVVTCVNPHVSKESDGRCAMYRDDRLQRVARGMVRFYDDMPRRIEVAVKAELIDRFTRVGYYDMRKGARPITPDVMRQIEQVCRRNGWKGAIAFDSYADEPLW